MVLVRFKEILKGPSSKVITQGTSTKTREAFIPWRADIGTNLLEIHLCGNRQSALGADLDGPCQSY